MKIVASIQVRMGSSRFPGKVMHLVAGKPLLGHLLDRLALSQRLDGIVVATAVGKENDVIEAYCTQRNSACFRGSENDVLDRTLKALQSLEATIGVEIFGDCPLIDPVIVDEIIHAFLTDPKNPDFVGNDMKTTYPPGMEVEVFKVSALEDAAKRISDPTIREHGTLFIRQNPSLYCIRNVEAPPKYQMPHLELEVDTEEDVFVVTAILEHFAGRSDFSLDEIIAFMKSRSDLSATNAAVPRRWKEFREGGDA
ncbi:MAG: glycosyltransferase family protein [Pseudomonadota bacterium]